MSDGDLLGQWRAQLKGAVTAHLPGAATDAGFWFGRAKGHAVAVMSYAAPLVHLDALPLAADAHGEVTLEGRLETAADYIIGYANQGRFGVRRCALDPGVARPRFRAICPIDKDDDATWVQMVFAPPRRVLAMPFLQVLIRHAADQPPVFRHERYGDPRPVADAAAFRAAITEQLNAVRATAGLQAVTLAPAESATATRLAGHYFAAELARGTATDDVNRIALGLLAGWDMSGTIRDGRFFSGLVARTRDAGEWLSDALMTPMGRATLLSPDIEEVALGPLLLPEPAGLAAVVAGYRMYHGDDHSADVRRVYDRLLAGRARLGLERPQRLDTMDRVIKAELARVQAGTAEPSDALNEALDQAARRFGASMRGYVIETTSVDALEIPEEIMKRQHLYMEVGVCHHKPAGAAWGQMVIVVIFADVPGGYRGQEI
jgi:hypothetical protein